MNKTRNVLIVVVALIVLVVGLALASLDWEYVEREVGLSSKANQAPLLAAQLFLASKNKTLTHLAGGNDIFVDGKINIATDEVLIIDEAIFAEFDSSLADALDVWMEKGGHLIYLTSPRREILELDNNAILSWAGLTIVENEEYSFRSNVLNEPSKNAMLTTNYGTLNLNIYAPYFIENCVGDEVKLLERDTDIESASNNDDENVEVKSKYIETDHTLLCDLSYGEGFLTFIPSLDAISNHGLRHLDHGEYLLWLTGSRSKINYLPSLHSFNWFSLLWQKSNIVILLFTAVLLLLLWHLSMRLGLPVSPIASEKNLFAEHINAVGSFMNRHGYFLQMHQALLQDIDQLMEKRNPKYKTLEISQQAKLLSQLTGKDRQHIEMLLSHELPQEADARVQHIKWFKELRNLL